MKRLLALRKRWQAFGLGSLEFLFPENRKILAFVRRYEKECILVVCNLSRFVQPVELDLSGFQQMVPTELFSRNAFPPVSDRPYFLTLGPHAFYWFSLQPRVVEAVSIPSPVAATPETLGLTVIERWDEVLKDKARSKLENCLQSYIQPRRWFGGKAREVKSVRIREQITVPFEEHKAYVLLLEVDYVQGDPENYVLPLAYATGDEAESLKRELPHLVICQLRMARHNGTGALYDATGSKFFARALLDAIARRRTFKGEHGEAVTFHTPAYRRIRGDASAPLEPVLGKAEQSNSALLFGDKFILKLFRRFELGPNPDIEIGRFLAKKGFPHVPPLSGGIEFRREDGQQVSLSIMHGLVANSQDAWEYTLDSLGRYYERVGSLNDEAEQETRVDGSLLDWAETELPAHVPERIGTYLESARLLGERTAAMHLALASDKEDNNFCPEPFTPFYQRSLYQSLRNQAVSSLVLLRKRLKNLPKEVHDPAAKVAAAESEILKRYRAIAEGRITGTRTRVHGDYHLGQVLHDGRDFFIIDFEGEPARSLSERRIKRTPLRDVAGMLRSFDYVAHATLYRQLDQGIITPEKFKSLEGWARFWNHWVSVIYLQSYLLGARKAEFLPHTANEMKILLEANLLNKAMYELSYELNSRPDWLRIPLEGILRLIEQPRT